MMRIAHVIHGYPAQSMGGTGLYVHALAQALESAGHRVAIVSPDPSGRTRQIGGDHRVEHWCVGTQRASRWSDTWNGAIQPWTEWCNEWKPDVVHVHHLSGWPLSLIEHTPCRTVLTLHDYAVPCARGQLLTADLNSCSGPEPTRCTQCLGPALKSNPIVTAIGRLMARVPSVYTRARRLIAPSNTQSHPAVDARMTAARRALDAADCVLSPSHDLAQRMANLGFRQPSHSELPLIHPPRPPVAPTSGPVRFLFASSIIPSKGIDRLLDCFAELDGDSTLTIAGHAPPFDGHPGFAQLLRERSAGMPRVTWLGAIPANDVPDLMDAHDVLVLPSIWPENSPLVVREATAQGLRVIGPKLGGCAELAPDAMLVRTKAELLEALRAESRRGHHRSEPRQWPSPSEHATHLIADAYR